MNKRYKIKTFAFLCIMISIISFVAYTVFLYKSEKAHVEEQTREIFENTVNIDYKNRVTVLTDSIRIITAVTPQSKRSTFTTTTEEISTQSRPNLSLEEKTTDFLQTILAYKNPVNIYHLDSLFQNELKTENIGVRTAICMTDSLNKAIACSRPDIKSFEPLFKPSYTLCSLCNPLQVYIKILPGTISERIIASHGIALSIWILLTLCIGYVWLRLKKKRHPPKLIFQTKS